MATENSEFGDPGASRAAEKTAAKKSATKKAGAKKSAAKKSAAKQTAAKSATKRATTAGAASKRTRAPGEATLRKQQAKLEEERAQYLAKIEANERRLHENRTATGQQLTPEQVNVTNDILRRQRERLAELDAYERSRVADGDPR